MKRALLVVALLSSAVASAGTKFVGGGLEIGPTAPVLLPIASEPRKVQVSQILYTQTELTFAANTHIIDVAWRKEGLGPVTGAGGCAVQVYMKNVTRQMGPFTVGSTQPLADALMNAQKVIDKPASTLPTTMGFVTLDQVENQFDFVYSGDGLEVTVVTDCRAAASPLTDAPIRWRYDSVPERVRVASGDTTDALILSAEPLLSSFRPHTRFRTLVETPRCEIRVAGNVLPNGGNFGVAPNHFAAGLGAPFAFEVVSDSTMPVTVMSVTATNEMNGTSMVMATTPAVVNRGGVFPTPVIFLPGVAGQLARFTMTWVTTAGTFTNSFQGMPTATPMVQPSASLKKPDGTLQTLTMPAPTVVQVGNVPSGHALPLELVAQQFGQGNVEAHVDVVSGDATVARGSTMVGTQQDVIFPTQVRAPATAGAFTTEVRITVGSSVFTVQVQGTVVPAPDIAVSVAGGRDIPNGGFDAVPRSGVEPMARIYRVANVGASTLYISLAEFSAVGEQGRSYSVRVLAPGASQDVNLLMPQFDEQLEPFESVILSNDPDELPFQWFTTSQFERGAPKLAVLAAGLGGNYGTNVREGVPRGGSVDLAGLRIAITLVNAGDVPLTITDIAEDCANCAGALPFTGPLVLAPAEEHTIERSEASDLESNDGTWVITSDDPEGPFGFKFDWSDSGCTAGPGPILIGLGLVWLGRRRRSRDESHRNH